MMKHTLLSVALLTLSACSTPDIPPAERLYALWEVDARDTLVQDQAAKALKGNQYQAMLELVSQGVGTHRYEFRRTGELVFGKKTLRPIAHFSVLKTERGRVYLTMKDVGAGIERTETAEVWFIDDQLHFKRGSLTLVMDPD